MLICGEFSLPLACSGVLGSGCSKYLPIAKVNDLRLELTIENAAQAVVQTANTATFSITSPQLVLQYVEVAPEMAQQLEMATSGRYLISTESWRNYQVSTGARGRCAALAAGVKAPRSLYRRGAAPTAGAGSQVHLQRRAPRASASGNARRTRGARDAARQRGAQVARQRGAARAQPQSRVLHSAENVCAAARILSHATRASEFDAREGACSRAAIRAARRDAAAAAGDLALL
jgi:hypothetical protein